MKTNNENLKKPFFASFLENQLKEDSTQRIQGGGDPSPTSVTADVPHTLKYPSDQEDNPTAKTTDLYQTMKYPSDNDEVGPVS
jgi:hypothetical protein